MYVYTTLKQNILKLYAGQRKKVFVFGTIILTDVKVDIRGDFNKFLFSCRHLALS